MGLGFRVEGFGGYNPSLVDRIWLWAHFSNIPIYPIYLLEADYRV